MLKEGDIILFHFPRVNLTKGKLRPALVIKKIPGKFDDWLICMISSNISMYNDFLDEIISPEDNDFNQSGLKVKSVIRVSRLAVIEKEIMLGKIGKISIERLKKIQDKICNWIKNK